MAKFLQLSIEDPCHEDWDKMTDNDKGKFCGSCQKQVTDFSGMTDSQIVAFFRKKPVDTVCGRFNDDQLDRNIPVPQKRIPWAKYFFQFTLPLFLTTLKAKSQGGVIVKTSQTETCDRRNYGNVTWKDDILDLLVDEGIQVKGVVLNEAGKPVPFASVEKGMVGTAADSTGAFTLTLAPHPKGIKINISSVGYESKEVEVTKEQQDSGEPVIIRLKPNGSMNEVVVTAYGNRKLGSATGGVTVRRWFWALPKPFPGVVPFKVYSNPAKPNSTVYIKPEKPDPGLYTIQLFNLSGQLIKQEAVNIEKGMGAISFAIPSIVPGTYAVTLLNKKTGKKYSEKLVIQ